MIDYGFAEYFEKFKIVSILPERRIFLAKIAIEYARICTSRWHNLATKPGHSTIEVDPNIDSELKFIEENSESGRFLGSAVSVGSLKTIKYFDGKTFIEIPFFLAKESIENKDTDLFKYCLGKMGKLSRDQVASFTLLSLMCYQDEILKTILTLPNFGAKEYHGYLKDFPLDFNAEILETPSPFAVNFVDEKRLGTDHDYEDARLEFGKVLELFLKRSSESRQILGSYARFDFAAQALANVSAQN